MARSSTRPRNRLLLALPASNLKRLLPQLKEITCDREQVLLDADSGLEYIYFPDNGVVSVLAVYEDGSMIEMATVGREGCTGFQAIFGDQESSVRFLVQIPGSATQMSRADFMRAIKSMPAFRNLMQAYIQAFLEQVLVSGACNGAHSLKERLARWLLMMRDRSEDDVLLITQSLLAAMLGVQRPHVTNALRQFKRDGLIRVGRGQIVMLDRQGLSKESCECYRLIRRRISSYLPKSFD
jgi:CRP-like cAMP-binding protein